jgi:uncharacterized protein (TIGR02145 family)
MKHFNQFRLFLMAIIGIGIILTMTTCKKDEKQTEEEKLLQKEKEIIELVEEHMPTKIVQYFSEHLQESKTQPDYDIYLDSLKNAIDDLYSTIEINFSLEEFKSRFEIVVSELEDYKKSTDDCLGLGYSKGAEVSIEGSGAIGAIIVAGLEASGGGGVEYVYDFVNLDRQLYYYAVCSYGSTYSAGLAAGLSGSIGFTGIYSLLTDITYHGNVSGLNKFEGPSLGNSYTLGVGLMSTFGMDVSMTIGSSSDAYADFSGILNLSPCPYTLTAIENSSKSYSFAVSGSLSAGPAVELLLTYSNGQSGSNSKGVESSYHRFTGNRKLAGLRMANDLVFGDPIPGINTTVNPFDLSAAAVAIVYGFKDFSDCPGYIPAIGTFPASNITSSGAQCGGVITSDNGLQITSRGFVWSTSENPTTSNNSGMTNVGTGSGEFFSDISGLTPNTTYYVRAYATNGAGTAYGENRSFTTETGGGTGTVTDIDGNVYPTIIIGTQEWMAENLKVTHYRNGDAIPNVTGNTQWRDLTFGAYCWYDNDIGWKDVYGALYNWYAVVDSRELCPAGWHVPTDAEWIILINILEGQTFAGVKMKSTRTEPDDHPRWNLPNTGATNESGFLGLPGGTRSNGTFNVIGLVGQFWGSSESSSSNAWLRGLYYNYSNVSAFTDYKHSGFSVRCIRD